MSPSEAQDIINSSTHLVMVDVREEDEYCGAGPYTPFVEHIPGALNYPWISGVFEQDYAEISSNGKILVVCRSGGRSAMASDFLCQQAGFESTPIYNMTGGMLAWEWDTVGCCYSDGDCDDSLFCNGEELCVELNCKPGTYPCDPYYGCDEVSLCWEHAGDADCDGLADGEDNCVEVANSTVFGTCAETIGTLVKGTGVVCTSDDDCGTGESCQMNQEDCNSNGIGDACECYADFDGDGTVYPGDLSVFLGEYGRTDCLTNPPCYADFNGDGTVYPGDLSVIVDEYGREDCPLVP